MFLDYSRLTFFCKIYDIYNIYNLKITYLVLIQQFESSLGCSTDDHIIKEKLILFFSIDSNSHLKGKTFLIK